MRNVRIPVMDRQQAEAVRRAMEDPTIRAMVLTMGTLLQLPSDRARARVLAFVMDKFHELDELQKGDHVEA